VRPSLVRAWFLRRAYNQGYKDAIGHAMQAVESRRKKPPPRPDRKRAA
jgi:hypothetical protein